MRSIGTTSPRDPDSYPCRAAAKEFKGKDIEKGIAVPTCVSVNKWVPWWCLTPLTPCLPHGRPPEGVL